MEISGSGSGSRRSKNVRILIWNNDLFSAYLSNFCTQFQHHRRLGEEERRKKCAAPPNPLKGHGGQKRRRGKREDRREDRRIWRPRRVYHRSNVAKHFLFLIKVVYAVSSCYK
jgi:hypothetical protein